MAFKVGQRVVVRDLPEGHPLAARAGVKAEVVQVDGDRLLIDDQIVNGVPQGRCTLREWVTADAIDHG